MSASGGKKSNPLKRYIEGAELLGCVLALSVESKNKFADSDLAMEAMAADVYQRLPIEPGLAFASGMSGGSRMAYLLAERNKNVDGVLACGSGNGVYLKESDFRDAKLRKSTYVYSLIGTNCFNRTEALDSHLEFPDDYRLRFFPGKHTWAQASLITEGMARVLGHALKDPDNRKWQSFRDDYLAAMLPHVQALQESEPWEAYYWAMFLNDFEGSMKSSYQFHDIAETLAKDPRVKTALKAEEAILEFASDFYKGVFYKDDKKPNPERKEAAEKLAEEFSDIPHGEIIKLLGDPC